MIDINQDEIFRITAGYTLCYHKRNGEILEELKVEPVDKKLRRYKGRLISNAHSEISRKRDHVFKQMKVGSKVQYFSYNLTYLIFDIVALSFNTFFPT